MSERARTNRILIGIEVTLFGGVLELTGGGGAGFVVGAVGLLVALSAFFYEVAESRKD